MKLNFRSSKLKKAAIIALPVVFALTAAVSLALLLRPSEEPKNDLPPKNNTVDQGEEKNDQPVAAPIETPDENMSRGLDFRSKGNGTCSVAGLGSCTDRNVRIPQKSPDGDTVVEIAVGAFSSVKSIVEVSIPDSVVSIGDGAFSGCSGLERIIVGDANPLYSTEDGVLFNKTKSSLLCYPAGKTDEVYVLLKSVSRISEGAFTSCPKLKELKFLGTRAQFKAIYIASGNRALDNITVSCSSADK